MYDKNIKSKDVHIDHKNVFSSQCYFVVALNVNLMG